MRLAVLPAVVLAGWLAGCAHDPKPAAPVSAAPQYNTMYGKPLTSLGAKYSQLTPAAQTTVLAEAGSAQIADVVKEQHQGHVYFIVSFRDAKLYPPMYVADDGSVLRPDLSVLLAPPKDFAGGANGLVSTNELSSEVLQALHEHAGGGKVSAIHREVWGDHTVYVVTFTDEAHHPALHLAVDGSVLYLTPHQKQQ